MPKTQQEPENFRGRMRHFSVMLNGLNFLLETDGILKKYGFFTTRYVEALDEIEAEQRAVDLIRSDNDLKAAVRNPKDDPPQLRLDSISELSDFKDMHPPGEGYSFYPEDQIEDADESR